jgi:steroid delta-isomerase-like uncharacterized protein
MTEDNNLKLAEQQIAALNAHDIDRYLQRIDTTYVGESETLPGPVHGPEGARQALNMLFTGFPDLRIEVEQLLASGNHVIARLRMTGTHKGNFAGVAPTNKSVSWQSCSVVELREGKAIRNRVYAGNASLLRQLGVLSLPKATAAG